VKKGYVNLLSHIKQFHKDWKKIMGSKTKILIMQNVDKKSGMGRYIAADTDIIHSPEFESGLVKVMKEMPFENNITKYTLINVLISGKSIANT
jgi:23S rRNA A2030 N6-methylase RlmJ